MKLHMANQMQGQGLQSGKKSKQSEKTSDAIPDAGTSLGDINNDTTDGPCFTERFLDAQVNWARAKAALTTECAWIWDNDVREASRCFDCTTDQYWQNTLHNVEDREAACSDMTTQLDALKLTFDECTCLEENDREALSKQASAMHKATSKVEELILDNPDAFEAYRWNVQSLIAQTDRTNSHPILLTVSDRNETLDRVNSMKCIHEGQSQYVYARDLFKTMCEELSNQDVDQALKACTETTLEYWKRVSLDDVSGRKATASKMIYQVDILKKTVDEVSCALEAYKAARIQQASNFQKAISDREKLARDYPDAFRVYR